MEFQQAEGRDDIHLYS